jgi:hypothetical protein
MKTCTICSSPRRAAIEAAFVENTPLRSIAKQFRISSSAVHRHKSHVAHALAVANHAREIELGGALLDEVRELSRKAQTLLKKAEENGDLRTALLGCREVARLLELKGKTGELTQEAAPRQFRPIFNIGRFVSVTVNHSVNDTPIGGDDNEFAPRNITPEPIPSERGDEE